MLKKLVQIILFIGSPITLLSSIWLLLVKKAGTGKLGNQIFMSLGILPVLDHYYQPLINPEKHLTKSLRDDRELPGIDFNSKEQLDLLARFNYNEELLKFPVTKEKDLEFYYDNGLYGSGDAEYLYNMIRHFSPKTVIEIGSGNSTLMAINAITKNKMEDPDYVCRHICIEPYGQPWLAKLDIELKRTKVEDVDKSFFQQLESDDILFIDSSHVIRPQGDVLFEFLEVMPALKSGVLVHIHDIFTPKDYLNDWVFKDHHLWNEQYLLEAFLTHNSEFRIVGALNYLSHNFPSEFAAKSPIFSKQKGREPGAFWIRKN